MAPRHGNVEQRGLNRLTERCPARRTALPACPPEWRHSCRLVGTDPTRSGRQESRPSDLRVGRMPTTLCKVLWAACPQCCGSEVPPPPPCFSQLQFENGSHFRSAETGTSEMVSQISGSLTMHLPGKEAANSFNRSGWLLDCHVALEPGDFIFVNVLAHLLPELSHVLVGPVLLEFV